MTRGMWINGEMVDRINQLDMDQKKRIAALTAAARAVVDAVWSPSTNVFLARSLICRICMAPDGRHSQSCPVGKLAALLEGA